MISEKKPEWLRKVLRPKELLEMRKFIKEHQLNTVCEEAACPNRNECYSQKTLTVMILGDKCTRNCRFCNVETKKPDGEIDYEEPNRVGEALKELNLDYVVITSVTRDDLSDGGAEHFARTIKSIKQKSPKTTIEVLIPDFIHSVHKVIMAEPEVISHNIETVPRLYHKVRPQANYKKSLYLLETIKQLRRGDYLAYTKTGIMVGLGETKEEVLQVMDDLRRIRCDVLTIGQYLRPSKNHYPVKEYVHPDIFKEYKEEAYKRGFLHVESNPYVRSSFHASEFLKKIKGKKN